MTLKNSTSHILFKIKHLKSDRIEHLRIAYAYNSHQGKKLTAEYLGFKLVFAMRRFISIAAIGVLISACSVAVNDVPRTTPPGKFKLGIGVGSYLGYSSGNFFSAPLLGIYGRYGLSEDMDLGFRVFGTGFGLETKKAFSDQLAFAVGINAASFGAIYYDIYGTMIYGFNSTGTIPYLYIKPHIQGYLGEVTTSDTTLVFSNNALALQGGFGFHGDPDKVIQPSAEIGLILPLGQSFTPTLVLSFGLNFQLGN